MMMMKQSHGVPYPKVMVMMMITIRSPPPPLMAYSWNDMRREMIALLHQGKRGSVQRNY